MSDFQTFRIWKLDKLSNFRIILVKHINLFSGADSSPLSPVPEYNVDDKNLFFGAISDTPVQKSFVTRRSRKRTVQFHLAPPSPIDGNADTGDYEADEAEIAEANARDSFPVWEASTSAKRRVRQTTSMPNLDESANGTPKVVLRHRLSMKDDTIQKLSQDFQELEEFTRYISIYNCH